ncbi:class I SAM-dependent methyltransferase [Thermoactinospora rubra]|uniref:class I SAM-dependent methyltransferase n=1 Tax=Thermoactinospora rubra TaxID=1088767 RepID=UPI000A100D23|nr:class I SAM-dependent methyltransferase [Thermoactinospora rubra]
MRGSYGFDAPAAFLGLVAGALVLAALAALSFAEDVWFAGIAFLLGAVYTALSAASHAYTTRRGKFAVWRGLLRLRGDERLLDLGCGRGAVLMTAATRLPEGRAVGVDLWRSRDQPGNAARATVANAGREGVADRVELVTGDLRALPFGDEAFDVVVSSLAVHNIPGREGRSRALTEALRVLRPGGRLMIADFRHTADYEDVLREHGVTDVRRRDLGWRFWYGGPWFATWLLEGTKPPRREEPQEAEATRRGSPSGPTRA